MPLDPTTTHTPAPAHSATADALTRALFGADFDELHEPWRQMLCQPEMHFRPDLTADERTALSYQRLRTLVHRQIGSPFPFVADTARLAAMHEWLAIADTSLASVASIHYNLHVGSLLEHHHDPGRDLDDVINLRSVGTFLATEIMCGNDAAALRTTATRDPDTGGFVLHTPPAAQKFMPNTSAVGGPKTAVVAARLISQGVDHGPFLFITPLSDEEGLLPGIRVRRLPAPAGTPLDHCITSFDSVQLPDHALLEGEHGRFEDDGTFISHVPDPRKRFLRSITRVTPGKLCMTGAVTGISRAALTVAVHYAHNRYITGPDGNPVPLVAHVSHHQRLIDKLATTYAMTALHRRTTRAWMEHDPGTRRTAEREVAIAKAWITEQSRAVALEARERCGAHGYIPLNGIAAYAADIEATITAEGDNVPINVKAAAEMLRTGTLPATDATVTSLDRTTTTLRQLHDLLTAAEGTALTRALDRYVSSTGSTLARWNAACLPALDAVTLHAINQAADELIDMTERCDEPRTRYVLEEITRLFLLRAIEPRAGALEANGNLMTEAIAQLPDVIEEAIANLVPHMRTCIDAFMIPEPYLATLPIAGRDYQIAYDPGAHWNTPSEAAAQRAG
ncbi:acyl-CoA dehydrogenase family protein [Streptomyces sp. NPDC020883]|uniref:acyl-CoA dehydrogenase family protein n=1 Tax=Streptomyces sp. NPDC020883 TaxID=3365099 RepID=UPI0037AD2024